MNHHDLTDFPHLKDETLLAIAKGEVYPCCPDPNPIWMAREILSLRKRVEEQDLAYDILYNAYNADDHS